MNQHSIVIEIIQAQIDKNKPFILRLVDMKSNKKNQKSFAIFNLFAEFVDDKPIKFLEFDGSICAEFSVDYLKEILRRMENRDELS